MELNFRVELSERARQALQELGDTPEGKAVQDGLWQLQQDPSALQYWTSKEDADGKHLFVGPKGQWKITFTVILSANVVYVHAIRKRRTLSFIPED